MRKPIAIEISGDYLCTLCNDGSFWYLVKEYRDNSEGEAELCQFWKRLPDIPQKLPDMQRDEG